MTMNLRFGDAWRGPLGDGGNMPVSPDMMLQPGQATSSLNPPSHWARMQQMGQQAQWWIRPQLYYPMPQILEGEGIAYQLRQRVLSFANTTINAAAVQTWRFDVPGPIYAFTGSAWFDTGAALPVGYDPRDLFKVQFQQANGDLLTEQPVLGSTILGTGKQPAFTGRSAWMVDNGTSIVATIIPLFADLEVELVAWHYEVRGPTNLTRT